MFHNFMRSCRLDIDQMRIGARRLRFALVAATMLGATLGCGSDGGSGPVTQTAESMFSKLVFNHRAVTLALTAPFDTIRLVATPEQGDGTAIPGSYEVRYLSLDTTLVKIDSITGAAIATGVTSGTPIAARLQIGNVTRTDTSYVAVTADVSPSRLATFSIQPFPGDSAKMAIGGFGQQSFRGLDLTMIDSLGNSQFYPVFYRSADVGVIVLADARNGFIASSFSLGSTWIYATTTVYGVTLTDSLKFTIGRPLAGGVTFLKGKDGSYFANPAVDTLAVGAGLTDTLTFSPYNPVGFSNQTGTTLDIVFDDSLAVFPSEVTRQVGDTSTVGNIRPWTLDPANPFFTGARFRAFPTAGTYHYHSTLLPSIHGTIVIVP